jgi:SAM-dependent methyltransferase
VPRVARTVIPRIKKSLRDRGLVTSLRRSFLLPIHLLREYRAAKALRNEQQPSAFDRTYGVDTDGKFDGWTHLSDLDIASPSWIDGNDYAAIEPVRFNFILQSLEVAFEEYTFVDFGSGKGRALLLASEFPFRRIIGIEFSRELHQIAERNILQYRSIGQKCLDIESQNQDFVDFVLPKEPLMLYFFDPCKVYVFSRVLSRIYESLTENPRPLYLVYVAPKPEAEQLLSSVGVLQNCLRNKRMNFAVYKAAP